MTQTRQLPSQDTQEIATFKNWLVRAALPYWGLYGTDMTGWGFHEALTDRGTSAGLDRRVRVQLRQIYVFARSHRLGLCETGLNLAEHGLHGLRAHYLRTDGLYRTLVAETGQTIDDRAFLYDQAFALLAFASAAEIGLEYREQARALLDQIETSFRHSGAGFKEVGNHPYQSNAHMHLFEALIAWARLEPHEPCWHSAASRIADFASRTLLDRDLGVIHEFYTEDWTPISSGGDAHIEPGHQFEWAWLLMKWVEITGDKQFEELATTLYRAGLKGIDPVRRVAVDQIDAHFHVRAAQARLWPQTEWLKAASRTVKHSGSISAHDYQEDRDRALDACLLYLNEKGDWRDKYLADGTFVQEAATASSFYHILEAAIEYLDLSP